MSQNRSVCRQKDLQAIKKQIIELPKKDAMRVVNSEIRNVVFKLNQEIAQYVKGHGRHEKQLISYGFLSIMKKRIDRVPEVLIYKYFLAANSNKSWEIASYKPLLDLDKKILEEEYPILLFAREDSSCFKGYFEDVKESKRTSRNTVNLYYPLNIAVSNGEDLQDIKYYDRNTYFNVADLIDLSNFYSLFYFDFVTATFKEKKTNNTSESNYKTNESIYFLEKFPDFGYLFELGRLNLNFLDLMPDLIQEKIHEIEKDYQLGSEEYLDYVRYIMFKFAEYNIPIHESDIQLVKRGYHFSGERRFLVRNEDNIEGIKVSLRKFGANTDDVIWDPSIVDSHQLFKRNE